MPELRKDPVVGRWVIISTERSLRPTSFAPASPVHDQDLADLPLEHIQQVLRAYRERVLDLHRDRRFRYVLIFKNHGAQAGATLEHTHTQLIATPIIPKILQEELEGSRRYYELKERCVFCDIVQQETGENNGRRVVTMSERFLTVEPFAPRFPFETWILPRRHDDSFHTLSDDEGFRDLAV